MHIQPLQTIQLERQELRLKEARIERESETLRLQRLMAELKKKKEAEVSKNSVMKKPQR